MKKETISSMLKLSKEFDSLDYELGKVGIFKYSTHDEADPGKERLRTDITVEIGGPSTHIKFTVMTREEHTIIKDAVMAILNNRKGNLVKSLGDLCVDHVSTIGNEVL